MQNKQITQRMGIFVLAGIIIGVLMAAGFEWTRTTNAENVAAMMDSTQQSTAPAPVNPADLSVAEQLSNVFANVAARVNPSVVTIFTETTLKASEQQSPFGDDFFRKFFQIPEPQGNLKRMGLGSGVIVDANGTILTNNHVVKGADNIKVQLMDGREFVAKVKGTDPQTDLAVITIDVKNLTPIKLGDSGKMRVGDLVLAIGSPLNPQLEHTVTQGIISAKGRSGVGLSQYEDYIQTDAAINPGNSGGALVNVRGELVGINSAIATQTGGFQGIGFAIPVNLAKTIMNDILTTGKVIRSWLGVYIQNVTPEIAKALNLPEPQGVIISKIEEDSPAQKAGLKAEDVVLKFNGKKVDNSSELSMWVAGTKPGTEVNLTILRNGETKDVKVKLEELNPQKQEVASGEMTYDNIGLKVANLTPENVQKYQLSKKITGVVVTAVDPNGMAAQVGIQPGDVVMKLNRVSVNSVQEFNKIMKEVKPGDNLLFYLRRGDANLFVAFTLPSK